METKIIELISEHFGIPVNEIDQELELRTDLNSTDLEIADFFQKIESNFQIPISHEEASQLQTVGDVISFVNDHVEENS